LSQLGKGAAVLAVGLVFSTASGAQAAHLSDAQEAMPSGVALAAPTGGTAVGSYTHTPAVSPHVNLPPGNGNVMTDTTLYYVFWLPSGSHYEGTTTTDTNYENLLIQWANDLGGSQMHNLVTQYYGNNGTISNNVTYGGSWTDTTAYPHTGSTSDPLQDSDIQDAVKRGFTNNPSWVNDQNHMVAVFTADGMQECASFGCTFDSSGGFCAYHSHFDNSGHDTTYAFMGYDDFVHVPHFTCDAGDTGSDHDPNRHVYPNNDKPADAEINTLSHEVIEAETDPHPNDTWTAPDPEDEIGDACNFNFAPRNDQGADVYLNGHGYIMQQEYSNAAGDCAIDLDTNGFCPGSLNHVCSPTVDFTKTVDDPNPLVDSTIHYNIIVKNTSDTGADTNVSLTDSAPPGYVITNVVAPGSQASPFTSTSLTVSYDTLAVHQLRGVDVTATVPEAAGSTSSNCANLDGQNLLGSALTQITSTCALTSPVKIPTKIFISPQHGDFNDVDAVTATLKDTFANTLSGKQLTFTLNGLETCTATTDAFGVATCNVTPSETSGPYTLTAAYTDASDPKYATSSANSTFTVDKEETTTAYTGPTVLLGASATLQGTLLEDGTTPIAGRTLTLGVGGVTCPAVTNASGVGTCTVSTSSLGSSVALTADFAGDGFYLPSSDHSKTAVVFAFPSSGVFAIGNAASNPVTWWSSTWNQANILTGGAPSAFKGFAAAVPLPTASPANICSGSWTTSGGNSPPPPATVPSFMGVVVADTVTKSGSTISGHYAKIVVVQTDPGYAPGPSNTGTGTIVATFCP
jgi:uncharacterized repeat protein (TIGR01451 family)